MRSPAKPSTADASLAPPPRARLPRKQRREQILESARKVFATYGAGAGTRQLADEAGINSALLYHYFDSKEALFEEAVVQPLQEMVDRLVRHGQRMQGETPADRIKETEQGLLEMVRLIQEILPLLGVVLFGSDEMGTRFYNDHLYPVLCHSYEAGRSGVAGWVSEPTQPAMATAIFGMCLGMAIDQHFRGADLDDAELAKMLGRLVLKGIQVR